MNIFLTVAEKSMKFGCWKYNIKEQKITMTKGVQDLYKLNSDEIAFNQFIELNHIDERDKIKQLINDCKTSCDLIYKKDDVNYIHMIGQYMVINGIQYIVGVMNDVN